MNTPTSSDPFKALGLPPDASEAQLRARYLELVKRFPPDREPDKFREVQAAYQAANDPLSIAQKLIEPPSEETPEWADAIEAQRQIPPKLNPAFVLSLGNRPEQATEDVQEVSDLAAGVAPNPKQREVEEPHE